MMVMQYAKRHRWGNPARWPRCGHPVKSWAVLAIVMLLTTWLVVLSWYATSGRITDQRTCQLLRAQEMYYVELHRVVSTRRPPSANDQELSRAVERVLGNVRDLKC